MRRISFGIAVGFMLAACGGDEVKPQPVAPQPVATTPPAPPPTVEPPKEEPKPQPTLAELQKKAGEGIGAAINAHDAKKIASFYAKDAVVKMAPMPDVVGQDAIAADWEKRFATSKDGKSMASRVFVKGDVMIVEWAWTGTHSGEMMGVKATEKPMGAAGADVMWFTPDGMIKEQHTYVDMGTIMSQIGASKQKGRPVPTLPTGAPQIVVSTNSAEETKNVESFTKMFAAFESKKEADFLALATDDITWDDMSMPETMKGKAAGKKFFAEITKAFPDMKGSATHQWGIGDFVISENALTGTHKAAFMGIQPTKKTINVHGLDIAQFNKEGKIIKGTTYANGAEMAMQLGLMPAPGAAKPAGKDAKDAPKDPKAATPATPATPAKTDAKPATPATPAKPADKK